MLFGRSFAFYEDFAWIALLAIAAAFRSFKGLPEELPGPRWFFVCLRGLWAATFLTATAAFITTLGLSSSYEKAFLPVAEVDEASWALVIFIAAPCSLLLDLLSWGIAWRPLTRRSVAVFLAAVVGFAGMMFLYLQAPR